MDILEKKNKYNQLFDYYGCLLTQKQQEYFINYYFEDLSLSEIANMFNVSRNAVHDQLNKIYNYHLHPSSLMHHIHLLA